MAAAYLAITGSNGAAQTWDDTLASAPISVTTAMAFLIIEMVLTPVSRFADEVGWAGQHALPSHPCFSGRRLRFPASLRPNGPASLMRKPRPTEEVGRGRVQCRTLIGGPRACCRDGGRRTGQHPRLGGDRVRHPDHHSVGWVRPAGPDRCVRGGLYCPRPGRRMLRRGRTKGWTLRWRLNRRIDRLSEGV